MDVLKYTDEEYEKHLTDNVGNCFKFLNNIESSYYHLLLSQYFIEKLNSFNLNKHRHGARKKQTNCSSYAKDLTFAS